MDILQLLSLGRAKQASDLHISPGLPPLLRIDGQLQQLDSSILSASDTQQLLDNVMTEQQRVTLAERCELDFSLVGKDLTRFRINIFRQHRGLAAAIRLIPEVIPSLQQLEFVSIVEKICHYKNGLVLVTGPTGSGKSTTLAAMLEHINQSRCEHYYT